MSLLGEDGRGYELARKLESQGVWRSWLGDTLYSTFHHFLSSPVAWDNFMRADNKTQIQLQLLLRARALLFDKASIALFTKSPQISDLNPNYLELHGDDVYFTLENSDQDGDYRRPGLATSNATSSKGQSKTSFSVGSRFSEREVDGAFQRSKLEELPETWYNQFIEKYRSTKSYRLMISERESEKRTPEQMSSYLKVLENHKRRRVAFKENVSNSRSNLILGESHVIDDTLFFPETMFTSNCVPDGAILQINGLVNNQKMQFNGVLDNLPQIMIKSPVINPIMIERLGIRPEYLNMEQGQQARGKNDGKVLGEEQALQMSRKVVARLLTNMGFESSSDGTLEVLAQFSSSHIGKLGRTLRLLADSYKKQCSAIELLKMFLKTAGYSNLGTLSELLQNSTKNVVLQNQQALGIQAQLITQQQQNQQPNIQQSQQILRQLSSQMQPNNNPQYIAFQQQQQQQFERMRRRQQQSTPRPTMNVNMNVDKDRPLVQVKMEKMENPPDFPINTNAFTAANSRQAQLQQLRQQQLSASVSSLHAQSNNNTFRPMTPHQYPQIQSPNMGMARSPPIKVEGFQELMGGDSSMKLEENKLRSPN